MLFIEDEVSRSEAEHEVELAWREERRHRHSLVSAKAAISRCSPQMSKPRGKHGKHLKDAKPTC